MSILRVSNLSVLPSVDYQSTSFSDRVRILAHMAEPELDGTPMAEPEPELELDGTPMAEPEPELELDGTPMAEPEPDAVPPVPTDDCNNDDDPFSLDPIDLRTCILFYSHTHLTAFNGTEPPTCYNIDTIDDMIEQAADTTRLHDGFMVSRIEVLYNIRDMNENTGWRHFQSKLIHENSDMVRIIPYIPRGFPVDSSLRYPNDIIDVTVNEPAGIIQINRNELLQDIYEQNSSNTSTRLFRTDVLGDNRIRIRNEHAPLIEYTTIDHLCRSECYEYEIHHNIIRNTYLI
jgi:hypothetical protein